MSSPWSEGRDGVPFVSCGLTCLEATFARRLRAVSTFGLRQMPTTRKPAYGGTRKASPPLWMGLADVTRRMCLNVACHSLPVGRASDMLFNTVLLPNRAIGSNRPIGGSQPIGTRTRRANARAERDAPIAPYRHTCMGKARYKMWQGRLGLATSLRLSTNH